MVGEWSVLLHFEERRSDCGECAHLVREECCCCCACWCRVDTRRGCRVACRAVCVVCACAWRRVAFPLLVLISSEVLVLVVVVVLVLVSFAVHVLREICLCES